MLNIQTSLKVGGMYDVHIPIADRLYKEHLAQLKKEGEK
jgi:hypothetical protein